MEQEITPYTLPDVDNHSFFYIDRHIEVDEEAKLHQHEAWELYYVLQGKGARMTGDTLQTFSEGDVVLIPPSMLHYWEYNHESANKEGCVRYLMVAFSHIMVEKCIQAFPEIRNRLHGIQFPTEAIKFGLNSSRQIRKMMDGMNRMDELGRLCEMLRLLPVIFTSADHTLIGKPIRIEKDVRRMQQVCVYVMTHYKHEISLNDIAAEVGMNRSAFCTYFKRCKGMTFSQYLTEYRINTACELLKGSQKRVSEICYSVGFNDVPHFVRVFTHIIGVSPSNYRKKSSSFFFNTSYGPLSENNNRD